jgi:hypothetical protein
MRVVLGFLITSLLTITALGDNFLREVPLPLARAFIPHGFDTDDSVEIVVMGILKSSCSTVGRVSTSLDDTRRVLAVNLTAYEYSGRCLKTEIPFYLTVHVGLLRAAGAYTIQDYVSRRSLGRMDIARAPGSGDGVDNILYAPLTDAYLQKQLGQNVLVLKGFMPLDCLTIDAVDVQIQGDVMVALPRLANLPGKACRKGNFPFTKTVSMAKAIPRGVFLLHVRSMGGQSINKIAAGT